MVQFADHPTVQRFYTQTSSPAAAPAVRPLDATWLRQLCRDQGADDVGVIAAEFPVQQRRDDLANLWNGDRRRGFFSPAGFPA